jgi:hypothetical protein
LFKYKVEGFSMFHHLDAKHLGMEGAPMFPEIEVFSWFQGVPGFLQVESKAEKGDQLNLEWVKVVGQVQLLLPIPVELEEKVTDVWFTAIVRVQNGGQKSRNAVELLPGGCLDEGITAL